MVDNAKILGDISRRLNKALDEAEVRVHGRATDMAHAIKVRGGSVTPGGCGKWLKGDNMPSPFHMRLLAEWLEVRAEWLEYGVLPMRGTGKVESHAGAGPKTLKLSARMASLERQGRLTDQLVRAIRAILDTAKD